MPSKRVTGLRFALKEISWEVSQWWQQQEDLTLAHFGWRLVPVIVTLLSVATLLQILVLLRRLLYPPTADQLHVQALQALQDGPRSSSKSVERAKDLLHQALLKDPEYTPARYSLAALYIYRLSNGPAALAVLSDDDAAAADNDDSDADWQSLCLDARAVASGNKSMVHSELQEEKYLCVGAAVSVPSSRTAGVPSSGDTVSSKKTQ